MIITFNQMPTQITINTITGLPPFNIYISDNILHPAIYVATISSAPYTFDVPIVFENLSEYVLKIVDSNGCTIYETLDFSGYKQFQDLELFEFMDNIQYNFQQ